MHDISPDVRIYMSKIGSKGGKQMSEAKRLALIANAKRPRPGKKVKKVVA